MADIRHLQRYGATIEFVNRVPRTGFEHILKLEPPQTSRDVNYFAAFLSSGS